MNAVGIKVTESFEIFTGYTCIKEYWIIKVRTQSVPLSVFYLNEKDNTKEITQYEAYNFYF